MKHKTSELSGALLDAAVAMAEGKKVVAHGSTFYYASASEPATVVHYSSSWKRGGPIIERERITVQPWPDDWAALFYGPCRAIIAIARGRTPLIAAMRAYVAAKLGDEVEL